MAPLLPAGTCGQEVGVVDVAENFAVLRHIALGLLKNDSRTKLGVKNNLASGRNSNHDFLANQVGLVNCDRFTDYRDRLF